MVLKMIRNTVAALLVVFVITGFQKNPQKEPWTEAQLMKPAVLAAKLRSGKAPVVYNIGPSGSIKNAVEIGPTQEAGNLADLEQKLLALPDGSEVVIYCGCCPFKNCPNIRPAFELANKLKPGNAHLLNIPKNLKVDWIDEGYPMK